LDPPRVGHVDWSQGAAAIIHAACLRQALTAKQIAEATGHCDPENAWVAGLLSPLGWLAVCAVDAERVTACLADPAFAEEPAWTQHRHWGFDQSAIARRLARRWQLPSWLSAVVGH